MSKSNKFLTSHQRSWVWGRHLILEILLAGKWQLEKLYLAEDLKTEAVQKAALRAGMLRVKTEFVSRDRLKQLCQSEDHQGFVARVRPFPYAGVDELLEPSKHSLKHFCIMDGIQDAYNFGAICRSAEVFGLGGIFIGSNSQTGVTSQAARSSGGAVNRVPISRVESLPELIDRLKKEGIQILAANEKAELELPKMEFSQSTAIIIGNEGRGVQPEVLEKCDFIAKIPQFGEIGSLNASAAAAIFFYEAQKALI